LNRDSSSQCFNECDEGGASCKQGGVGN